MSVVFDFADRLTDEGFEHDPIEMTAAGIPTAGWPDWSPEGHERVRDWAAGRAREVADLPGDDRWDAVGRLVMADDLDLLSATHDLTVARRDLNSVYSPVQRIRDVFDSMPRASADDWSVIAGRLDGIGAALGGYRRTLTEGVAAGDGVARRQVVDVVAQLREHTRPGRFFDLLDEEGSDHGIGTAVESGRRAFAAMADWLESDYLPHAEPSDSVGVDRYRFGVRCFLRLRSIDLEETYAWGWDEVNRLFDRMATVSRAVTPDGVAAAYEVLTSDPGRAAHGVEAFRDFIVERLGAAQEELQGSHFDIPEPLRRLDVVVAPPGGSLGAEYRQPSEDLSRPGAVVYHPGSKDVFPLYDEVSTAYHEGFPGHHLQSGMQVYLGDRLTRWHRLMSWNSGYGEGWALYAEHLMGELGFYERPDYELGLLANQMVRACRVVIDIGAHVGLPVPDNRFGIERWDFDSAVRLLEDVAFLAPDYARSEVTRYLGWPGQAISYKVGERVILDLREEARREDWYTDKEFHARVVGHGPVGLDSLRGLVL